MKTLSKPVRVCHRHTGFWYRDYTSIGSAARDLQLHPSSISRCLDGLYEYAGAYTFTHIKEEETNQANTPVS